MNTQTLTPPRPAHERPPGPPDRWWGLPLIKPMRADYLGFVRQLQQQYGDISCMRLGRDLGFDLMSPDLVREALVTQAPHLIRWERGIEVFEQAFGQSVLVTEGATWQRQRRMLMPAFTPKRVAGYAGLMTAAGARGLDAVLPAGQDRALVTMDQLWTTVAMDVIMRTLFSHAAQDDAEQAAWATQVLSEAAFKEMFWPFTWPDWLPLPGKAAKRRALRTLRSLVRRQIEARKALASSAQPPDDLLGRLLALRDDETGAPLSDDEVFYQCMVSFQAGHETTATALLWWSHLMAEHPEAAARAQAEVDAALGDSTPTADDLPRLPWLTASLKEAMRLYPPAAAIMTRRTTAPLTLGGWAIPKAALLRITPWVLQRDARWFPEPSVFRPERFLPGAPELPRGAWMPFGAGPRVCIGQHFAMLEMTLLAAMLLQRFTLHRVDGAPNPKPVLHVTLRPQQPVQLWLQRRHRRHGRASAPVNAL